MVNRFTLGVLQPTFSAAGEKAQYRSRWLRFILSRFLFSTASSLAVQIGITLPLPQPGSSKSKRSIAQPSRPTRRRAAKQERAKKERRECKGQQGKRTTQTSQTMLTKRTNPKERPIVCDVRFAIVFCFLYSLPVSRVEVEGC
jgi:hypothetical protein